MRRFNNLIHRLITVFALHDQFALRRLLLRLVDLLLHLPRLPPRKQLLFDFFYRLVDDVVFVALVHFILLLLKDRPALAVQNDGCRHASLRAAFIACMRLKWQICRLQTRDPLMQPFLQRELMLLHCLHVVKVMGGRGDQGLHQVIGCRGRRLRR